MATETVQLPGGEQIQLQVPDNLSDAQAAQYVRSAVQQIGSSQRRGRQRQSLGRGQMGPPAPGQGRMGPPAPSEPGAMTPRQRGRRSVRNMPEGEGRVEAARGGVGSGLFGIDVPLAGAERFIRRQFSDEQEPVSFSEAMEIERGRREGLRERFPATSAGGTAAGIAGSIVATPARVANSAWQAGRGFFSNLGRSSTVGAGAGGTQTLLEEGEAAPGATTGAVAGPVAVLGTQAVSAVPSAARRTRNFITGNQEDITPGVNALARRINVDPDVLRTRFENLRQQLGRPPMMAEIMDDLDATQIAQIGRFMPQRVGQPLREVAEDRAVARQGETAAAIRGGRVDDTPEAARVRRTEMSNRQFGAIADEPVTVDEEVQEFLTDPNVLGSLGGGRTASGRETIREFRGRMQRAADGGEPITAQDFEDLRQATNLPEVAQESREILSRRIPESEQAIQSSARRMQRIEGLEQGGPLIRTGRTRSPVPGGREEDLGDVTRRGRRPEQAGVRRGARTELARGAERSPAQARQTVQSISEDEGLRMRLDEIFPEGEARRIRGFAGAENRAARSLEGVAQMGSEQLGERATDMAARTTQLGTLGGAATAQIITDVREIARLPLLSARRVTTALTDPSRAEEAIRILQARNVSNEAISRILDRVAVGAGLTASSARETEQAQ